MSCLYWTVYLPRYNKFI